jgi:hypothetical protein
MPDSLNAIGILLALTPGLLYLRLTESVRKPGEKTSLQEAAEVVAVGLVTTGAVVGLALLVDPTGVEATVTGSVRTEHEIRSVVWLVALLLVSSYTLAAVLAAGRHCVAGDSRYGSDVWQTVFGEPKAGYLRHAVVELADGRTFDGPMHSYTVTPLADGSRQVALKGDIRVTKKDSKATVTMPYTYVLFDASAIIFAAMTFVPNSD